MLIELVAAAITIASIVLATRQRVAYYPTGIVSVLLYGWIYYGARLYAEAGLQVVWLALMIYGWYAWLHGGRNRQELPVTRTPPLGWLAIVSSGMVMTAAIIFIQRRYTDNPAPVVDSTVAAWSIVAQWMTARKWIENWLFWGVINVVAIGLYVQRELWVTAVLYVVLLILAGEGYRKWRRTLASA